jgi:hypothetical protein
LDDAAPGLQVTLSFARLPAISAPKLIGAVINEANLPAQ